MKLIKNLMMPNKTQLFVAFNNNTKWENSTNNEHPYQECLLHFKPVYHVSAMIISFFILTINALVLVVFSKSRNLRKTPSNYFLASLSVNDLLSSALIVLHITPPLYAHFNGCQQMWTMFQESYFIASDMLTLLSLLTTVSHLLLLSSERFISLFWALRYRIIITRYRIVIVLIVAWTLSVTTALIQLVWIKPYLQRKISVEKYVFYDLVHIKIVLICFTIIPTILLLLQYGWLFFLIRRLIKSSLGISKKEKYFKQRKAIYLYFMMFSSFVIFCIPYTSVKLIISFDERLLHNISPEILEGIFLLRFCVSISNPLLYTLYNKDFKRASKLIVKLFTFKRNIKKPTNAWKSATENSMCTSQTDARLSITKNSYRSRGGGSFSEFAKSKNLSRQLTKESIYLWKNVEEDSV